MSDVFPKWTNKLPLYAAFACFLMAGGMAAAFWYYFTPGYTRPGYQPIQPVPFSHATHCGQLGYDCRYCHSSVEESWYSNLPAAGTCMNCHNQVLKDDPRLALVKESAERGTPIPWIQIHKLPDYVHFNHSAHVRRGVGCISCHGDIHLMEEVFQSQPLSMTFCLACHRQPVPNLRPLDRITDMTWDAKTQLSADWAQNTAEQWQINPSTDCSACHR